MSSKSSPKKDASTLDVTRIQGDLDKISVNYITTFGEELGPLLETEAKNRCDTTANFDLDHDLDITTNDEELTIDDIEKPNDQEGLLKNVRIFITEHHHRKLPFHSYKLHLFYAFQLAAVIASIHLTTYGKYEKMGDSDRKDLMARFEEEDALFGDKPNSHEIQRKIFLFNESASFQPDELPTTETGASNSQVQYLPSSSFRIQQNYTKFNLFVICT